MVRKRPCLASSSVTCDRSSVASVLDQDFALELWASGNMDARTLAFLVADPTVVKSQEIDSWLRDFNYHLLVGLLADVAARSPYALAKWKKWSASKSSQAFSAAYCLLSSWLVQDPLAVPQESIDSALVAIQTKIRTSPNRARYSMNQALIAIGIYRVSDRKRVFQVAKTIGKVEVDHGNNSCKTPHAITYIEKALHSSPRKIRPC